MVPVYYDLHIHSALSPCADDDMTPNDIIGMALLNELDLIAVTDHNSIANAEAVIKAARAVQEKNKKELIVLPGIEVSTSEEVHVLCLFCDIESAQSFEAELAPFFSALSNRVDIFGNQILFDENDRVTGEMERMLIAPTGVSFDKLHNLVYKHNGAFIPAHIDRDSFSVISNLGFLPPHLSINAIEISPGGAEKGFDKLNAELYADKKMVFSSDAHQLWAINEKAHFFMLPELSAAAVIDFLR